MAIRSGLGGKLLTCALQGKGPKTLIKIPIPYSIAFWFPQRRAMQPLQIISEKFMITDIQTNILALSFLYISPYLSL